MAEIGAYEAKTHLSSLLERVAKGERFVITRHGRPVAELVPVSRPDARAARRAIAAAKALRASLRKRGVRLSDLLAPGQRLRELAHDRHRH